MKLKYQLVKKQEDLRNIAQTGGAMDNPIVLDLTIWLDLRYFIHQFHSKLVANPSFMKARNILEKRFEKYKINPINIQYYNEFFKKETE